MGEAGYQYLNTRKTNISTPGCLKEILFYVAAMARCTGTRSLAIGERQIAAGIECLFSKEWECDYAMSGERVGHVTSLIGEPKKMLGI